MSPENCSRRTPAPRELPPRNKATLHKIQVVFQTRYDRMNYQISELRQGVQRTLKTLKSSDIVQVALITLKSTKVNHWQQLDSQNLEWESRHPFPPLALPVKLLQSQIYKHKLVTLRFCNILIVLFRICSCADFFLKCFTIINWYISLKSKPG